MPTKKAMEAARRDKAEGKSPSTQAGEFVKEEIHKIREGKHGAANTKQAMAIALSEARRAGVDLKPPTKGKTSEKTRKSAESAYAKGQRQEPVDPARSRASEKALKKEPTNTASRAALSQQSRSAARQRSSEDRSTAAKKAAATRSRNAR